VIWNWNSIAIATRFSVVGDGDLKAVEAEEGEDRVLKASICVRMWGCAGQFL
jgi:hypothetical protein